MIFVLKKVLTELYCDIDDSFLASAGLGLLWQPSQNLNIRVDYGIPFVDIETPSDSLQDNGLHFSLTYSP